jgi:PAS domain S-box-containing protein
MNTTSKIQFSDIFVLEDIQRIQDQFSDATGVASVITYPDGRPITRPSNFCRLCNEIIRKTETGLTNCFKSDAEIGRPNSKGPVIQPCLSGGLWDAGASIIVGDQHIANWLIGQVKNEILDHKQMIQYAEKIGADKDDFMKALEEVPVMSREKFEKVAAMLYAFANEISSKAYNNNQLNQTIKELKEAEEKLVKSEVLNRTLIKHLPQRIFVKDPDSRYILCNDIYSRDLGIDSKEIAGKTDFDFFQSELAEKYRGDDQKVISEGIQKEFEEKYSISGQERWTHVIKVPYRDPNNRIVGVLGIFEDITDRKLRQEEIILKNDLLQALNAEKDKFFSIIAHDLRSPFSSFLGLTQLISDELGSLSQKEIKNMADNMRKSAKNLYTLLENLLEWSKMQRGQMDFNPVRFNLLKRIKNCTEMVFGQANIKNVVLSTDISENLEIVADEHMFDTVIRNLVSNAIKFTPVGGRISISARLSGKDRVEIRISDTGIGMSPDLLSKIFKLDQQTSRKGTAGEPSTGLGLLLCKEFIEKCGGEIWAESEVGKGSTFHFTFAHSNESEIEN